MNESILARVARGDAKAVRECIDEFGGLVWAIARRMTRSRADAEDAVQEIFIDVWRSAGRFDAAQGSEKVFITTIARRRLIDRIRRGKMSQMMDSVESLEDVKWAEPGNDGEVRVEAERAREGEPMAVGRAAVGDAAGHGAADDLVPQAVKARGIGAALHQVGLVDPAALMLDVGLIEDGDGVGMEAATDERHDVDEPPLPGDEIERRQLGEIGQ